MAEELKACLRCGCIPDITDADYGQEYWCQCTVCGLRTKSFCSRIAADMDWNTRAKTPSQGGEAVAWQAGFIESGDEWDAWQTCSKEHHDFVKRCPNEWPDYEVRALYTHPADQVAEPDAELVELLRNMPGWIGGDWAEEVRAKLASLK
jgi:hypothetical protein